MIEGLRTVPSQNGGGTRAARASAPALRAAEPIAPRIGDAVEVTAQSGPAQGPHRVTVVQRVASARWGWIEQLRDKDPHLTQRSFHPRQVIRDPEIVNAFGTSTPHSGDALLMYAGDPPPGAPKRDTPVILVHGASKNANFWWDPHENGSDHGLPQRLRDEGYHVYAVSFAHNQDDNNVWAQQLSNAIGRVKRLEGVAQVDLVGHSKGGVPVRAYLSNFGEPWMTAYQGDVRRAVFVASPLGGIDFSFRHPSANLALYGKSDNPYLNAPMSWDRMIAYGWWHDVRDQGFSKDGPDYWPGQRQLLDRWDGVYKPSSLEPDVKTTIEGGQGLISTSRGIDHFINESGRYMPRLRVTPIDPHVDVAVLAGNRPDIKGISNEHDGESDGLLFLRSALEVPRESRLVAEAVFPLNHKEIVADASAHQWVADVLAPETLPRMPEAERDRVEAEAFATGHKMNLSAKVPVEMRANEAAENRIHTLALAADKKAGRVHACYAEGID